MKFILGGGCLARGYINNPVLTDALFCKIPKHGNQRFYRTGDLAKYLDNHNIEFIGRVDNQVKIRGYRVELSEIEACVTSIDYVKQAHCQAHNIADDYKIFVHVVLAETITEIEVANYQQRISNTLKSLLPKYMLPSEILIVNEMPLTINGKIDSQYLLNHYLQYYNQNKALCIEEDKQSIESKLISLVCGMVEKKRSLWMMIFMI